MKPKVTRDLFLETIGSLTEEVLPCGNYRTLIQRLVSEQNACEIRWKNQSVECYECLRFDFDEDETEDALISLQCMVSPNPSCQIPGSFLDYSTFLFSGELELGCLAKWHNWDCWMTLGKTKEQVTDRLECLFEWTRETLSPVLLNKAVDIQVGKMVDALTEKLPVILQTAFERDGSTGDLLQGSEKWIQEMKKYPVICSAAIDRYIATVDKMNKLYGKPSS